jgi:hypothetical protein
MSPATRPVNLHTNDTLSSILGDIDPMSLPVVAIQSGPTDYIDRVPYEMIVATEGSHGLVVFQDHFRRMGFAFTIKIVDVETNEVVEDALYTVFQRYTGSQMCVLCRSHRSKTEDSVFASWSGATTSIGDTALHRIRSVIQSNFVNHKPFDTLLDDNFNDTKRHVSIHI